jgi:UDP-MurNAc hydroxylase
MRLEMIGHASIYVQTSNLKILMDPVLWDPHQEGLFDIHPEREVLHDRLPPFNVLILSHRHLDHFDIRSLASLPKTVQVFIPKDPTLEEYLRRLGFSKITGLKDFSEVTIGATTLFTTRSENPVPEYGIVFSDETGTIWNQVDSVVTPKTVQTVRSRFPRIDFLLACWQPMMEASFQNHRSIAFPHSRYQQVVYNVCLVEAGAVAPGANAFRYKDGASWLNGIVFPVDKGRFLHDIGLATQAAPPQRFPLDPGDSVVVRHATVERIAGGCSFVRRTNATPVSLAFRPVTTDTSIIDDNLDAVPEPDLEANTIRAIENDLTRYIAEHPGEFEPHRRWQVIYQVEVVLPSGSQAWTIDFRQQETVAARGPNPLANVFAYITGSALYALGAATRGWDFAELGGYYRRYEKLYAVTPYGLVRGDEPIADPLELLYPYHDLFRRVLDRELQRWLPVQQEADLAPASLEASVG